MDDDHSFKGTGKKKMNNENKDEVSSSSSLEDMKERLRDKEGVYEDLLKTKSSLEKEIQEIKNEIAKSLRDRILSDELIALQDHNILSDESIALRDRILSDKSIKDLAPLIKEIKIKEVGNDVKYIYIKLNKELITIKSSPYSERPLIVKHRNRNCILLWNSLYTRGLNGNVSQVCKLAKKVMNIDIKRDGKELMDRFFISFTQLIKISLRTYLNIVTEISF